jgi:hypothetical protein
VKGNVPSATTEKPALSPAGTVCDTGWVVMVGAVGGGASPSKTITPTPEYCVTTSGTDATGSRK